MNAADFASNIFELYPPFRQWDDVTLKSWTGTVVGKAGPYSPEVRAEAFKTITEVKHKDKPPQPATILEHLREADRKRIQEERKDRLQVGAAPDPDAGLFWSADRLKWADEVLGSPIGKKAAKEGWVVSLRSFLRDNGRAPNDGEIAILKRNVRDFHAVRERCHAGTAGPFSAALAKWADDIVARQKKLEARFG